MNKPPPSLDWMSVEQARDKLADPELNPEQLLVTATGPDDNGFITVARLRHILRDMPDDVVIYPLEYFKIASTETREKEVVKS